MSGARLRELLLRLAALVGLGVSVLLWAEYSQPSHALCGVGGGCEVARLSVYSHILGIPLPIIGTAYFVLVLLLTEIAALRRWLLPVTVLGGLGGLVFLGIQAVELGSFCRYCVVVDLSSVVVAALVISQRAVPAPAANFVSMMTQATAAVVVALGAVAWQAHVAANAPRPIAAAGAAAPVPEVVQREQNGDMVTIVEFLDFECPACRAQHGHFSEVLPSYEGKVRMVVKNMPLPQHEHALDAARAYCCAEESGAARAMADRLFHSDDLSPQDCEAIAVSLGLDRDEFRRCVASTRVTQRLDADRAAADAVGLRGLPTFWIGPERFEGVHDEATLRASIDRALLQTKKS